MLTEGREGIYMEVNGKTRLCGLIGNPIEHTLSPMIHNALAEKLNHNLIYVPFKVEESQVKEAVQGAYALNVLGLNVTVPHKSTVINCLKEMDGLASSIGAVNTLVRVSGGYKGYNTDMSGLYRALLSEGIQVKGEDILLLGAGGAARAVAFMCAYYGAANIYILNRTIEKAKLVAEEVNNVLKTSVVVPMRLSDYGHLMNKKYLVIQGTSVGLYPHVEDVIIEDEEFYKHVHTGYDLIYRPAKTKFMLQVEAAGGKAYHGLKMLLFQGIDAYEMWNQTQISEKMALEVYELLKKEMGIHG